MNRVIAAVHAVKFAQHGLADFGKPGNYLERQIGSLEQAVRWR